MQTLRLFKEVNHNIKSVVTSTSHAYLRIRRENLTAELLKNSTILSDNDYRLTFNQHVQK